MQLCNPFCCASGASQSPSISAHAESNQEDNQDCIQFDQDECGFVEETCIIPSSQAFVQEFHDKIRDAAANSEISFDSGTYSTISDYLIKMFQERNDVSAVINFEYDHQIFFANEIGATIECL